MTKRDYDQTGMVAEITEEIGRLFVTTVDKQVQSKNITLHVKSMSIRFISVLWAEIVNGVDYIVRNTGTCN